MRTFNPFQWLIDASQRRPAWWCRQCGWLALLALALIVGSASIHHHRHALVFVVAVIVGSLIHAVLARNESQLALVGAMFTPLRVILWTLAWLMLLGVEGWPHEWLGEMAGIFLHILSMALYWSFAACRPPAPPKPGKNLLKLAPGGSAP